VEKQCGTGTVQKQDGGDLEQTVASERDKWGQVEASRLHSVVVVAVSGIVLNADNSPAQIVVLTQAVIPPAGGWSGSGLE
jgi:hypothetical protein